MNNTYRVTTEGDCEGRTTHTIAYATGNAEDIKAFYDRKKMYEIKLEKIIIENITPKVARNQRARLEDRLKLQTERETLSAQHQQIEKRLDRLNNLLR